MQWYNIVLWYYYDIVPNLTTNPSSIKYILIQNLQPSISCDEIKKPYLA